MNSEHTYSVVVRNVDLERETFSMGESAQLENQSGEQLLGLLKTLTSMDVPDSDETYYPAILVTTPTGKTFHFHKDNDGFYASLKGDINQGEVALDSAEAGIEFLSSESVSEDLSEEAEQEIPPESESSHLWRVGVLIVSLIILVVVWTGNLNPSSKIQIPLPDYQPIKDVETVAALKKEWAGLYKSENMGAFILEINLHDDYARFYPELSINPDDQASVEIDSPRFQYRFARVSGEPVLVIKEQGIFKPSEPGIMEFEGVRFIRQPSG